MKKIIYILSIFIALNSLYSADSLRNRYSAFGYGGLDFHTSDFRALPGVPNCCPVFKSGQGLAFGMGLGFEFPISENMFLGTKLALNSRGSELSAKESTAVVVNLEEKLGVIEHLINSRFYIAGINPYLSYNYDRLINFSFGATIGYLFNAKYDQKEQIIEPTNTGYFKENQSRIRNVKNGNISDLKKIQAELNADISFDFKLNETKTWLISPFINFSYGLTDFVNNLKWKSYSINAGLAFKYSPFDKIKIYKEIFKIDTVKYIKKELEEEIFALGIQSVVEDKIKLGDSIIYTITTSRTDTIFKPKAKAPVLAEKIKEEIKQDHIFKITESKYDNNEVKDILIKVKNVKEFQPVLNYVFFDKNSAQIDKKYFPEDFYKLNINSKLFFYRQIFDLVAKNAYSTSNNIVLIGTVDPTSEKNNCELALERAKNVKKHLIDNYKLNPSRIIIRQNTKNCAPEILTKSKNEDGYSENRRVEISFENQEQFSLSVERSYLNPVSVYPNQLNFILDPKYSQDVSKWNLKLYQGNKEFFNKSNETAFKDQNFKFTGNDVNNITDSEVNAELDLTYSSGKKLNDKQSINVSKIIDEDYVYSLTLKPFKVGQANLDESMKKDINSYISQLTDDYILFIKGYTDLLGLNAENKGLSQTRADAVSKYIKTINPKIKISQALGVGASEFPMGIESLSTPEERFMSRTVSIQAIKLKKSTE